MNKKGWVLFIGMTAVMAMVFTGLVAGAMITHAITGRSHATANTHARVIDAHSDGLPLIQH